MDESKHSSCLPVRLKNENFDQITSQVLFLSYLLELIVYYLPSNVISNEQPKHKLQCCFVLFTIYTCVYVCIYDNEQMIMSR